MEHVSLRLRAAICVALATLFSVIFAVPALAATTPAVPAAGEINDAQTRVNFAGSVIGTVGNAQQCDDPLATGTCNDFFLTTVTAQAQRLVEARIDWPIALDPLLESDLDLFVFECRQIVEEGLLGPTTTQICDQLVAASQQDRGNFEYATFQAQSGDVFRIVVVPAFVFLQQDYSGCAAFVDAALNCPDPEPQQQEPAPIGAQTFADQCNGPDIGGAQRREIAGGGKLNNDNDEHFQLDVREREQDGFATKGKVQWKDKEGTLDRRFRGQAQTAQFTENGNEPGDGNTEGMARICGFGTIEERADGGQRTQRDVCFIANAADNGEPGEGKDTFTVEFYRLEFGNCIKEDTQGGQVTAGNIQAIFRPRMA